jgi:hypothetical protein
MAVVANASPMASLDRGMAACGGASRLQFIDSSEPCLNSCGTQHTIDVASGNALQFVSGCFTASNVSVRYRLGVNRYWRTRLSSCFTLFLWWKTGVLGSS